MKSEMIYLKAYPNNWSLIGISLTLLIIGDAAQAMMSALGVAEPLRYLVIGFVVLMVSGSVAVLAVRFYRRFVREA